MEIEPNWWSNKLFREAMLVAGNEMCTPGDIDQKESERLAEDAGDIAGKIIGGISDAEFGSELRDGGVRRESRHSLGRAGEDIAARHLESLGLIVLSRNWRCPQGELDIVATDRTRLVFCEVKTRSGPDYGGGVGAINQAKIARLRRLARAWLRAHQMRKAVPLRFDVVAVVWPPGGALEVQHIPAAF